MNKTWQLIILINYLRSLNLILNIYLYYLLNMYTFI